MGIRINKVAGWGLLEVAKDDPRINWASPLLTLEGRGRSRAEYIAWLTDLRERLKAEADEAGTRIDHDADPIPELMMLRAYEDDREHNPRIRLDDPDGCIYYDHEWQETSTFVVRPVPFSDWYRHDDTLDWIHDEMVLDRGLDPHTDQLYANPYPFSGTWMNRHTGERFRHDVLMYWVRTSTIASPPDKREPWEGDRLAACDMLAQEMGFTGHAEASDTLVPNVPSDVRRLVEFGQLFTNSRTVLELRPVLYTFWR